MARMPSLISDADLSSYASRIELLLLDVDGVLTDGVISLNDQGVETKHFHVRDGAGISLWRRASCRVAILSGRQSEAVTIRAVELGITPVIQGAAAKLEPFEHLLRESNLNANQVAYVGDDLPDLPILKRVGLAACPADAAAEVREVCHFVSSLRGGHGVVREVIEWMLKARGIWPDLLGREMGTGSSGSDRRP